MKLDTTINLRKELRRHVTMQVRVHVKGARRLGLRIRVGTWLIKLAAWIIGVDVTVDQAAKLPPDWPAPPSRPPQSLDPAV